MPARLLRLGLLGFALAVITAGAALAQPFDKRTYFTFSGPVAVPGVTLPAGQYLFRLADSSSRDVVQVLSADGKIPYAQFFAYRPQRFDPARDPEIRFMETAPGMPAAVRTWWYPNERTGYEFVYPKDQARLLAKGTGEPVLTTVEEVAKVTEPEPELVWVAPTGEETAVAEVPAPQAPVGVVQEGELARAELPKTAGSLPLVALAGGALLLAGAGLRALRQMLG
jgi:hypothetical protein